jgi:hypothetical protein
MFGMQDALEEGSRAFVAGKPVAVQDETVNFVGEDKFIDGDASGAKCVGEARCLLVGDIRVVVAVD